MTVDYQACVRRVLVLTVLVAALPSVVVHTASSTHASGEKALASYVRLPLRFEPGQDDGFVARGSGYAVSLSSTGVSLLLKQSTTAAQRVTVTFAGGNTQAHPIGRRELPGVSNHLFGNDPKRWRTGIRGFGEVEYRGIYRGVDVVYYGNQQQLEFDFVVAPGATPDAIALNVAGATNVSLNGDGDLVVTTAGGGRLIQHRPDIYQDDHGTRRSVRGGYVVDRGGKVRFRIGRFDRRMPLVIDPRLSYATYLGGVNAEFANGVAIDAAGNMIVAGVTYSPDFPVVNAAPPQSHGSGDAFVAKLTPAGDAIVYSTYFGGAANDIAQGVAVDADGNAYVAGNTDSLDFPATGQIGSATRGGMFVAKFDAAGGLVYATRIGGAGSDFVNGIAVDSGGRAHIAGSTSSADFPVVNPLQASLGGFPASRTHDSGGTWIGLKSGLQVSGIDALAFDPTRTGTAYAGTLREGLFRTTDDGATWTLTTLPPQRVFALATQNATLFAGGEGGIYRSTDHGDTWTNVSTFFNYVTSVAVTQDSPSTIYLCVAGAFLVKSVDGGDTWTWTDTGLAGSVQFLAASGSTVYAATTTAVVKSVGGGPWVPANGSFRDTFIGNITSIAIDPSNPQVVYLGTDTALFKTVSGGDVWTPAFEFPLYVFTVAVAPSDPLTILVATQGGALISHDGLQNGLQSTVFTAIPHYADLATVAFDPTDSTHLYVGYYMGPDAFVARLSADGSRFEYATFLGGAGPEGATAIAVDSSGNDYVAGGTFSEDFPTLRPIQSAFGGTWDSFVAKISAAGSLVYSTYLGGSATDYAARIAVDGAGRAYVTGLTESPDFPTVNAWQPTYRGGYVDAFVSALNEDGSAFVYSTFLGGSGMETDTLQSLGPTIAVTQSGEASVTGTTQSTDFPVTADAWHGALAGGVTDVFVTTFDASGALRYSTYLGGTGQDAAQGIAMDATGTIVISGYTLSTDFATRTAVQPAPGGSQDAFVAKISPEAAVPDTIAPTTTIALSGTPGAPGWYKSSVTVSLSAIDNDGGRGVRFIEYTTTGGGGFRRYTGPFQIVQSGTMQITARATDWAGNVESPAAITTFKIDTTPPSVGFSVTGTLGSAGWFKSPVNVSVFAVDPQGTGVVSVEYRIGDGAFQTYSAPFSVSAEGTTPMTARATDANGNVATTTTSARIDSTAPHTTIAASGTQGLGGWYRSPVTIALSAADNAAGSGVARIDYSVNGAAFQRYTAPVTLAAAGTTSITARATDIAGNVEIAPPTTTVMVDASAPHTTIAVSGTPGLAGWYRSPVTIALSAVDNAAGSGLALIEFSANGAAFQRYSAPVTIAAEGSTRITARATDVAGNVEIPPPTTTVMVDGSAPILTVTLPTPGVYLHTDAPVPAFSATDAASGVQSVTGAVEGQPVPSGQPLSLLALALGAHTLTVTATDVAGNQATQSQSFTIVATVDSLITAVNLFGDQGRIDASPRKSLLSKLNDAKAALDRGNVSAASGDLKDFISQCAAQSGKGIAPDVAAWLTIDATYVLGTI